MCVLVYRKALICLSFSVSPWGESGFHLSSPFISFFGQFGAVGPCLKNKVLSFPFNSSSPGFFRSVSLSFAIWWPWNRYFCVTGVIHSQYMPQPFPPPSLDYNAYFFPFWPFVLPPHFLPYVASTCMSLKFSWDFYAWMCRPCSHNFCSFSMFHFRIGEQIVCWN